MCCICFLLFQKVMHGLAPYVKTLVVQGKMASAVGMVPVTEKLLHVPASLGGKVMTVIPQFALDSLSAQVREYDQETLLGSISLLTMKIINHFYSLKEIECTSKHY